jgi:hypothetical protein
MSDTGQLDREVLNSVIQKQITAFERNRFVNSNMLFRILTPVLLLGWTAFAQAQGPRSQIIAPPDLWVRADVEHDWGTPLLLSTCETDQELITEETTLPAAADGSYTVVRTFTSTCPCENRALKDQQFIHVLAANPLPTSQISGLCAPTFSVLPEAEEVAFGSPVTTTAEAVDASGTAVRIEEVEHVLWRNACGLGASWVVWEATGACGEVARHAFKRLTTAPEETLSASTVEPEIAVPVDEFDANDWGVGPLDPTDSWWAGAQASRLYRTKSSTSGTFAVMGMGCSTGAVIGEQTIEIAGNHAPWIRFQPEVEISCGTPREDWPTVKGRDRLVGSFGDLPSLEDLPVQEEVDTLAGDCPGNFTIERLLRVEDADGAVAEEVQLLLVVDQTAPTFYASPEEVVWSGEDWPPLVPTAQAEDACSCPVERVWSDSTDCMTGRIIRLTTATDACGNAATLRQVIVPAAGAEPTVLAVGCSDPLALNFTGEACYQTLHCLYPDDSTCLGDLDGNGQISTGDLLALLGIFGTWCTTAP